MIEKMDQNAMFYTIQATKRHKSPPTKVPIKIKRPKTPNIQKKAKKDKKLNSKYQKILKKNKDSKKVIENLKSRVSSTFKKADEISIMKSGKSISDVSQPNKTRSNSIGLIPKIKQKLDFYTQSNLENPDKKGFYSPKGMKFSSAEQSKLELGGKYQDMFILDSRSAKDKYEWIRTIQQENQKAKSQFRDKSEKPISEMYKTLK